LEFKVLVDILASLSSTIAILSVVAVWCQSIRKPLKIISAYIHKQNDKTKFILVVKNVKNYPVTIKRTQCFRRKEYEVQKKCGGKPEYSELFLGSEMIFTNKEMFKIAANGHTDIRIDGVTMVDSPAKLLFLLYTSHGYHELWCKEVVFVDMEKVDVYSLEYKQDFDSKWSAKAWYYWKQITNGIKLHRF
jgi:hypothetical protein